MGGAGPCLPLRFPWAAAAGPTACVPPAALPCLPFAAPLLTLFFSSLVCSRGTPADANRLLDGEPSATALAPPGRRQWVIAMDIRWVAAFLLVSSYLLDLAALALRQPSLGAAAVPAAVCIVGTVAAMALYHATEEDVRRRGALRATLAAWLGVLAIAVGQLVAPDQLGPPSRVGETLTAAQAGLAALLALCDAHVLCSTAGPSLASMGYAAVGGEDPGAWELHTGPDAAPGGPGSGEAEGDRAAAHRHDVAPFLSRVTFAWVETLLRDGYRRPLTAAQLGAVPALDRAARTFAVLQAHWATRWDAPRPSLAYPVWRLVAGPVLLALVVKEAADLLGFVGPMALKGVVHYMAARQSPPPAPDPSAPEDITWEQVFANGWVLAAVMFVAPCCQSLLLQAFYFLALRASINVQSALMALVYHKALELNPEVSSADVTVGSVVGHMSADVAAISSLFQSVTFLLTAPIQLAVTVYLMYRNVGWASPASLLVIAALVPVQLVFSHLAAKYQKRVLAENDGRLRLLNELLQHMRAMKLYAWEDVFAERVAAQRHRQLTQLWLRRAVGVCAQTISASTPALMMVAALSFFALWSEEPLSAGAAFSTLTLFTFFQWPMFILPHTVNALINAVVSGERLVRFLTLPAMDRSHHRQDHDTVPPLAAEVRGTFRWTAAEPPAGGGGDGPAEGPGDFVYDVAVPRGCLTIVVGAVRAGKSTFLKALLGNVPCAVGHVHVHGRVAYAAQQAAVFTDTLQNNILFGRPLEPQRYQQVLLASGLLPDLKLLPGGDQTEIGERGANLSGGQRQRVSLARALYAQADIVLLDDPFSALDAHVGDHVFRQAVLGMLRAEGATVVLVTHQRRLLRHADHVVAIDRGHVAAQGTPAAVLLARPDLRSDEAEGIQPPPEPEPPLGAPEDEEGAQAEGEAGPPLVREEDAGVGAVGRRVYAAYFAAGGALWVTTAFLLQAAGKVGAVGASLYLSAALSRPAAAGPGYDLPTFAALSLTATLLAGIGTLCTSAAAVSAARVLHERMLRCVARCPIEFFDATPIGRIVNRFSTDVQNVDMALPDTLHHAVQIALNLLACALTILAALPVLTVLLVPVTVLYWFLQHFFRFTSRELQRLNDVARSPILAHLSETLGGIATIQAYGDRARWMRVAMARIDHLAGVALMLAAAPRWLGLRLDVLGALVVSCTAAACLWNAEQLSAGLAGLCLASALTFVGYVSLCIRIFTDVEMQMNSVDRIARYSLLEAEPDISCAEAEAGTGPESPAAGWVRLSNARQGADHLRGWPARGEVVVRDLVATYRPGVPPVFSGLSVTIRGGERVGVCGRTGSGKTSLLLCLFRMLYIEGGSITIDGLDVASVPLHDLRARLSVIPQDPTLFAGTVRFNLDPEGLHPDPALWAALRAAQLEDAVQTLDDEVRGNGDNYSGGQRQMFCLARAFLKQSTILCLDEATASIDAETDARLQQAVRRAFAGRTVLTIAHRVRTILDYDRVLVLDRGRIVEYDRPEALLQADTVFRSLVDASAKEKAP